MSLQFGVNIPVQRRACPCHCLCLLSSEQTIPYLCLVSTTKQQARLAKQLGYGTRLWPLCSCAGPNVTLRWWRHENKQVTRTTNDDWPQTRQQSMLSPADRGHVCDHAETRYWNAFYEHAPSTHVADVAAKSCLLRECQKNPSLHDSCS